MKILYLSRAVLPSEVSHSLSIMRVCQAFVDDGHVVLLTGVTASKNAPDAVAYYGLRGGFRVETILSRNVSRTWYSWPDLLSGLAFAWKTRTLFGSFRPDVVYSRLTLSELVCVPRGLPIIYEMHSLGPLASSRRERYLFTWLLRHKTIRRIIVTTNVIADIVRQRLPHTDVVVARLSAERPIDISGPALESFRGQHLQGREFAHHVGYTGYLDRMGLRGTEIICRAAAAIPQAAFHIVGGTPEAVSYWREFASSYNRHDNIFFYGYRNPAEMPFFLDCFDVVLAPLQFQPSRRAPAGRNMSPLKLPQYMAYGKAIIASDLPAHRELLTDGLNAVLVPCDDQDSWISAIRRLLDDPRARAALGRSAREIYEAEHTPEIRVRRILAGTGLHAVNGA